MTDDRRPYPVERRDAVLADLLDVHQVAALLGLSNPSNVAAYRTALHGGKLRYPDFPAPVLPVDQRRGRCYFWDRHEILAWRSRNPGARPRGDKQHDPE